MRRSPICSARVYRELRARAASCLLAVVMLVVCVPSSLAQAQDAGVRDAGVADPRVGDAAIGDARVGDAALADAPIVDASVSDAAPMLAVGAATPAREVLAAATDPARPIATAQRAPLLTAAELVAEVNRRAPPLRAAYVDPARLDELARDLVRERVLANAARSAGLLDDPEVARELERVLARVWLERALAADAGPPVDERAARAFYDAHLADYTKPEQVRVLGVVLATRADALRVIAEVSRVGERRFEAVARRRSIDAQSRRRDGSLGWMYPGSRPERALIDAAFALRVGETIAQPLEIDGRFYVVRTVERRPPESVPFERARSAVVSRLRAEHRQRVLDALVAQATRDQAVRVRPAAPNVRVAP